MATTPAWQAARTGFPGNLNAVNASAHINQALGTHAMQPVCQGNALVTPSGGANFTWYSSGSTYDVDQPFTMPAGKTTIGRVAIPVQPVGGGADLRVTLYPDSAGVPNTASPVASSMIPASWISNLAAVDGLAAGGPLAGADFNTLCATGGITTAPWTPTTSGAGFLGSAAVTSSGNYVIIAGGYDGTNYFGYTSTAQYLGGSSLAQPAAQPTIPTGAELATICTTSSSVVFIGGIISGTASTSNVWTASWDPNTGVIGSWSLQAAYPSNIYRAGSATWGNTVYVVGGVNGSNAAVSTVYYATLSNGQISTWVAAPSMPHTLVDAFVGVVGNWLVVAGGAADATDNTIYGSTYYARIHADGSLGSWQSGPTLPVPVYAYSTSGWNQPLIPDAFVILGGQNAAGITSAVQILSITDNGPAHQWTQFTWTPGSILQRFAAAFPTGSGTFAVFNVSPRDQYYEFSTMVPVPMISVPLCATGLTAGAKYHLVLQQARNASPGDYLAYGLDSGSLPSDALRSLRYGNSWSTAQTGYSVPLTVYDQGQVGPQLHTWEDPNSTGTAARTTTFVNDYRGRLLGFAEQTAMPNNPLNSNQNFTTGVAPWTASGGTITQSSAQTRGGNPYSGLLTPNGTAATAWAQTELLPVIAGQYYLANGWVYSPPGYASVSLSVIWYDHAGTSFASSNTTVSVPAGTWTQLANTFQAPAGAAQAALAPAEGGTPPTSATLYLSGMTLTSRLPGCLPSVAQVAYNGTWPPVGVTQLA